MDKEVIDELFSEEAEAQLRHDEGELAEVLGQKRAAAAERLARIAELKEELARLQDDFLSDGESLQDLYDDLDFSQQSLPVGTAVDDLAEEMCRAADDLDAPVDALSDLLLFRFRGEE
ncbi:MAG: hypothetical protein K6E50_06260 [Lachnospiraceae bacterium]|nr:hypothetical protein [Lachnospiraceae bacterium]